jgi:hypothetical protein
MKAIEINGQIKIYSTLPKSWNGNKHYFGGFNNLSDAELKSEGFYDVVVPEYNNNVQKLSSIYFDSNNEVFTYGVEDITWSEKLSELKENAIQELKQNAHVKLSLTDWYVIRKYEEAIDIPDDVSAERANIKSNLVTKEEEINALTTKSSVILYNTSL